MYKKTTLVREVWGRGQRISQGPIQLYVVTRGSPDAIFDLLLLKITRKSMTFPPLCTVGPNKFGVFGQNKTVLVLSVGLDLIFILILEV